MNLEVQQVDLIDGERMAPTGRLENSRLENPSTGAFIALSAQTDAAMVERAIAAASRQDAEGTWRQMPIEERAEALLRVATELDARASSIGAAEALGTGVVISVAGAFGGALAGSFRDAVIRLRSGWATEQVGDEGRPVELLRIPWGPTVIIVPWNAPAAMAAKKSAYALAVGAPVILKPPEWAPFGCNIFADAIHAAGLPAGVFQMVHGGPEVGQQLVSDRRVACIAFTGSVATGRYIARAAAEEFRPVQLELGGNNPVIILPDADIAATAKSLAGGMTKLNGQWCEGPGKVFLSPRQHDELLDALLTELGAVTIGSHDDPLAQMGPLAKREHRDRLQTQVDFLEAQSAIVHIAAAAPDLPGWFWPPRVVTGAPDSACMDELFGPVLTLHEVNSVPEAIALANDSPYGLAGYVFGTDIDGCMGVARLLRFGEVKINGTSLLDLSPRSAQSFWRSSGFGGHGDAELFAFFCGTQIVGLDRPGLPI